MCQIAPREPSLLKQSFYPRRDTYLSCSHSVFFLLSLASFMMDYLTFTELMTSFLFLPFYLI